MDQKTGEVRWTVDMPGPTWGSPVPIDDQIVVGDCDGVLHNFDISNPLSPPEELWTVELEGCIESTPAVWDGVIYLGTRGGPMYAIGDRTGA
jgi:outer membrane protein assembly factor BamB